MQGALSNEGEQHERRSDEDGPPRKEVLEPATHHELNVIQLVTNDRPPKRDWHQEESCIGNLHAWWRVQERGWASRCSKPEHRDGRSAAKGAHESASDEQTNPPALVCVLECPIVPKQQCHAGGNVHEVQADD